LDEIQRGKVVLLLGAGASMGAIDADEQPALLGWQLRDLLADRFLGGAFKDRSLAEVAELAQSESDLGTVQRFIASKMEGLRPAKFHYLLPQFRWRGIATLNFDQIVERAYDGEPNRRQSLVVCLDNSARMDEVSRDPGQLALLKLHGCISRPGGDPPFILGPDQYANFKASRLYLFRTLEEWMRLYTLVLIGASGLDSDLRALLQSVAAQTEHRPRFYLVRPGLREAEVRLWESKRISPIHLDLEQFLGELDKEFPAHKRALLQVSRPDQPISSRFRVREPVGDELAKALEEDLEYLHPATPVGEGAPSAFYRGFSLGWYPIARDLDVPRSLVTKLLNEVISRPEVERPSKVEFYVVRAEGGAGKSVALRRLAWDAAAKGNRLVLFLREFGRLSVAPLIELHRLTGERIFVVVDDVSKHVASIEWLISEARRKAVAVTLIGAERLNYWHVACSELEDLVTEFFELRYLSRLEIEYLVALLREHKCLGSRLTPLSDAECVEEFVKYFDRQLLVALHEVTLGRPFEEIVEHEFNQIQPDLAKRIYLSICCLNRLGIPVRAGLIARVFDVSFQQFKEAFLLPLERVVNVDGGQNQQDVYYTARHAHVAEMVFESVLRAERDRHREYQLVVSGLNLAFSTDLKAFRLLLRAKTLAELFPTHENVLELYRLADTVAPADTYLMQQRANYERIRPNGNLNVGEELLRKAIEIEPKDPSLIHSLAELLVRKAEATVFPLERTRLRAEARSRANSIMKDERSGRYARVTLVKIAVAELRELLSSDKGTDVQIDNAVRVAEEALARGLQEYPDEVYLRTAEADLAALLKDNDRVVQALKRAFEANKRDSYVVSRYSRLLEARGHITEARAVLEEALRSSPSSKELNFRLAELLRSSGDREPEVLLRLYRRAFTDGDTNLEAQFWYARFADEFGDDAASDRAAAVFRSLREASISANEKRRIRDYFGDAESRLRGAVASLRDDYGFVNSSSVRRRVFAHARLSQQVWSSLAPGRVVDFRVGYSLAGPVALDIRLA